ncbi:MAG: flagellar biosynthesis anti-sigma factor FlgM [Oscillospiraceae bacterium]|nr:flagellar biosynthesis anti-sigma factor FlgM [Oscillospiraceae bacterium]
MRIDRNNVLRYYENTKAATTAQKPEAKQPGETAPKTDRVSFSAQATLKSETGRVAQSIATEIEADASAAKLQQLSQSVQKGEYRVSTQDLVDSILKVWG